MLKRQGKHNTVNLHFFSFFLKQFFQKLMQSGWYNISLSVSGVLFIFSVCVDTTLNLVIQYSPNSRNDDQIEIRKGLL